MIKPKLSVQKMGKYDPPLENRRGMLRLDFNENAIGCSPNVIRCLKNLTAEDLSAYPEYAKFKKKLASYLKISDSRVILTNGADEAIKSVMDCYLENGNEVIVPVPSFKMFEVYASISGVKIKRVLYEKDLGFPINGILESINPETRMIVLANPNNPTGTEITRKALLRLLEKAKNSIIVVDEAYYQFYINSCYDLVNKYDNLIVIQTFSKAFGLAALRLGYIISNEKIIRDLEKVVSPYGVNYMAVIAGNAALDDIDFVQRYVSEVKKGKILLESELGNLGIKTFKSKANFFLADFGKKSDYVTSMLRSRGILVRDRSKYPLLKNCIRITVGTEEQSLKLIKELKNILRENTLIFDMDGVLVDVSKSYRLAIKKTAEYFTKQTVSEKEIQMFKERGGFNNDWDITEVIIISKGKKVQKQEIIAKFQEFYLGGDSEKGFKYKERWLLSEEIIKILYKKFRLGIVTGRPREEALFTLRENCVLEYFEVIIAMEDVPARKEKPNPYSIKKAIESLGGSKILYFGDNIDDVRAARNAEVVAIGVIPANIISVKLESLFRKEGARKVLRNINDICEVLK